MASITRLRLRVLPGARRSEVVGPLGAAWKLRVQAAPERGRANDAVEALLAGVLSLPKASVEVVAGHTTQDKIVALTGIELAAAETLLAAEVASRS